MLLVGVEGLAGHVLVNVGDVQFQFNLARVGSIKFPTCQGFRTLTSGEV